MKSLLFLFNLYTLCLAALRPPFISDLFHDLKNKIFRSRLNRPYVTVSWAQSLDGTISSISKTRTNISSESSFLLKHSLRSLHEGVLVGSNTLNMDKPLLTVRFPFGDLKNPANPRAIILNTDISTLNLSHVLLLNQPVVFTCSYQTCPLFSDVARALLRINGTLVHCGKDKRGRCDISDCLHQLYSTLDIRSIFVEGGGEVLNSFLKTKFVDKVIIIVNPSLRNGFRFKFEGAKPITLERFEIGKYDDIIVSGEFNHSLEPN